MRVVPGKRYGLLTERQYTVLRLRIAGKTQEEIARMLGTSRENISIIEKRAWRKVRLAEETLKYVKELLSVAKVTIPPGTHLVQVPGMLVTAADKANIKLRGNFTRIYDEIRFRAEGSIKGTHIVKPVTVVIYRDGTFEVVSEDSQRSMREKVRSAIRTGNSH